MITVALVEDDASYAAGVQRTLEESGRCRCLAVCASAEDALARLPALGPQVVLMDIELPGANGVEGVRQLSARLPDTQFLMLTAFQDNQHLFPALAAGATGYLVKGQQAAELLAAIEELHAGGSPMSAGIARKVVTAFRREGTAPLPAAELSPREREILDCLAAGQRYKEIAESLGLSFHTIRAHVRHIYKKLHVRSRAQALRAIRGLAG